MVGLQLLLFKFLALIQYYITMTVGLHLLFKF